MILEGKKGSAETLAPMKLKLDEYQKKLILFLTKKFSPQKFIELAMFFINDLCPLVII